MNKRKPQPRLAAPEDDQIAVADWASLFGDLSRPPMQATAIGDPVDWRIHDRTHVEFAIDYPIGDKHSEYTWEAYFFVPESFRLDRETYDKKAIYADLWSYVRYAVPHIPFHELATVADGSTLDKVRAALYACAGTADTSSESARATRRLRLFACLVRSSGLSALRELERLVSAEPARAKLFSASCSAVANALRGVIEETRTLELPPEVRIAAAWTDEDVSIVLETFTATLGVQIDAEASVAARESAEHLASHAVREARHRRACHYDSVGSADAGERELEHFEFRRHMLKRFTASALWLTLEVHKAAGAWVVHTLYAVAAAAAMALALAVSLRMSPVTEGFLIRYAIPVVLAYAVKDRVKALLQSISSEWIARRFPDRRWSITDRERKRQVGTVDERVGLLSFDGVASDVLAARRMTREHALEEHARPERVLWHRKTIQVPPLDPSGDGTEFSMLTEIFRLNLSRWLSHTDDPNRKVVFADPSDAHVYSASARRVYNVNLVYRLTAGKSGESQWHRIRVVVSRKGIERIEPIC